MTNKDALSAAVDALFILSNKECGDLPEGFKENCEERKKRFREALELIMKLYLFEKERK